MSRVPVALRRAAALGLVGVLAGLMWIVAAVPLVTYWQTTDAAIAAATELRARLGAIIALEAFPGAHQELLDGYRGDFLSGASEATIAAELQARLRAIVTANDCELLSAQALASRKAGLLTMVGLRLQMRGSLDKMQRIIHAVETAQPLLFVERAVLRTDPAAMATQMRAGLDAVRLVVDLDIAGARWPVATAGQKP